MKIIWDQMMLLLNISMEVEYHGNDVYTCVWRLGPSDGGDILMERWESKKFDLPMCVN